MADYNSWNQQVVNGAPKKPATMAEEVADARNQRSAGTFYDEENPNRGPKNGCSRALAFLLAIVLFLGGVAIVVYCVMVKLHHNVLPFCIECSKYTSIGIGVGAGVAVFGLIGLIAAKSLNRCIGYPYALIVMLIFLALLALGALTIYYGLGAPKVSLLNVWEDAVKKEPAAVCELQSRLKCSGYQLGCCATTIQTTTAAPPVAGNTTTPAPPRLRHLMGILATTSPMGSPCWNTTGLPTWYYDVCANCTSAADNEYAVTCNAKVEDEIRGHVVPLVGIFFGAAVIALVDVVAICRMLSR